MVKILIENVHSKIVGFLPHEVQIDLDTALSYKVASARHMPSVKAGKWDGVVRLYYRSRGQQFYTGLLAFVREILKNHNIDFEINDRRIRPAQNLPGLEFNPPEGYTERDYQTFTIDRSLKFTRGIIGICTGGGKTVTVTKLISEIKTYPFIFYVLTKDLMYQAHGVLGAFLNEPIGLIGDGKCEVKKINVMTIQTAIRALNGAKKFDLKNYKFDEEDVWNEEELSEDKVKQTLSLIKSAKGLYFDETHHAAAQTCQDVLNASTQAYWRFGGSATPYRDGGDEILIQAMFGAKIVDISASYLIKKDYLVKPYIFFVPIDSKVEFHTYAKIYKHCISANDELNDHVADLSKFLSSVGLSNLILVQHYPQGNYIKARLSKDVEFVTGKMTSTKRSKSIADLRGGLTDAMVATSLADEGLDIPSLFAAIMAGGGASISRVNQRIGRTLRKSDDPNIFKDKSIVIIYEHNARFLEKHAKKIRRMLKKEPEFEIIDSNGVDYLFDEICDVMGIKKKTASIFDL